MSAGRVDQAVRLVAARSALSKIFGLVAIGLVLDAIPLLGGVMSWLTITLGNKSLRTSVKSRSEVE